LSLACEKSNIEVVKVLLESGANCIIRPDLNMTALHCAAMAQYENVEIAKLLIAHKCPINARTTDAGETPFFLACNSGFKEFAAYLIGLGVDPNECSATSRTCFQQAVFKGFKPIVRLLINHKYRLTTQDYTSCSLLIMDCYHDGDIETLKYLLDTKTIDRDFLLKSMQDIPVVESFKNSQAKPNSMVDLEAYLNVTLNISDSN
jgi:ankyrin repeat protein